MLVGWNIKNTEGAIELFQKINDSISKQFKK